MKPVHVRLGVGATSDQASVTTSIQGAPEPCRCQTPIKAAQGFFVVAEHEQAIRRQAVIEDVRHTVLINGLTLAGLLSREDPDQAKNWAY